MRNEDHLTFRYLTDELEFEQFRLLREDYMRKDIIPHCSPPIDDEDQRWFFSDAYKEHMAALFRRKTDPLRVAYLRKEGTYAGFIEFIIYSSEDGKCFIVEYAIEEAYRGKGLGTLFFERFEEEAKRQGAVYFALNTSNERNRKFWSQRGFESGEPDAYGDLVFMKHTIPADDRRDSSR